MKVVSRFEAHVLRVLQCFLRHVPPDQALPVITGHWTPPECLSRAAVELIQDHLAKGCTLWLARWPRGGWRRERFVRGEQVKEGRLWERSPPQEIGLVFSRHTLRFLIWITANKPGDEKSKWSVPDKDLTPADCLLFYLAYTALRETDVIKHLKTRPGFVGNLLLRLAFPEEFPVPAPGEAL